VGNFGRKPGIGFPDLPLGKVSRHSGEGQMESVKKQKRKTNAKDEKSK
jgi:hypothetical protein